MESIDDSRGVFDLEKGNGSQRCKNRSWHISRTAGFEYALIEIIFL
jgi:hypothetical protein